MNDGNCQNDAQRYYLRSRSLRAQPEMEGDIPESSVSSRSSIYPYGYASPISNQGDSSPNSSVGDRFSITGPALNDVPFAILTLPPPSVSRQSLSRRSLSTSSFQESTSDEPMPHTNRFSGQPMVQSLQMTPSQGFPCIESAADSMNHVESPLEDGYNHGIHFSLPSIRTTPMLDSPNPTSLYHNNGFPPDYVPEYNIAHMDAGPRYDYQDRPLIPSANWPSHPSSPDNSQNEASIITQDMSAVSGNLSSHFSGQHELPPSSLALSFPSIICSGCGNQDFMYQNMNFWFLHYWKEHPPPAGSPDAWRPRTCLWEGCELLKSFRTHKSWLEHAYSVHYRRFWCTFDNCPVAKPFGSQNTLERHFNTKHAQPIPCTRAGCQAKESINLWRKDKLTKHEAKYHGPLICTVADCPRGRVNGQDHGFSEQADLDKHMKVKHRYLPTRN